MLKIIKFISCYLLFAFLFIGCKSTNVIVGSSGGDNQEFAIITDSGFNPLASVRVWSSLRGVDGTKRGYWDFDMKVSPGKHSVDARCDTSLETSNEQTLEFNALAGHKYKILTKPLGGGASCEMWIEDVTNT